MKILHVAAHLGGGIGKAHAAMRRVMPKGVEQTFLLLEKPVDERHVDDLRDHGAKVIIQDNIENELDVGCLIENADVVQLEYWGHPLLDGFLKSVYLPNSKTYMPKSKTICWCHVSTLYPPIPSVKLVRLVSKFVMTIDIPPIWCDSDLLSVINSGFGFDYDNSFRLSSERRGSFPVVGYLGTVDFKKMHRDFFRACDLVEHNVPPVRVWGHISQEALLASQGHRVDLCGHTLAPKTALLRTDIFMYLLSPTHYGTAENALVEAMSLGVVPVVLDNPAESQIVTHGKTGFLASTVEEAAGYVNSLVANPELREELSANAVVKARTRSVTKSVAQFVALWDDIALRNGMRGAMFEKAKEDSPAGIQAALYLSKYLGI